jgi:uncharacterized glyoxalase superfamily protein PhnB
MSETTSNPAVWPCLIYRDAEAARVFLTDVFGFTETLTVRGEDDPNRIVHAEVKWPEGGGVMFGSGGNHPEYPEPVPGTQWVNVWTADPKAIHDRSVSAGAKIVAELHETDYASSNVGIADPEGNVWTFTTYQGA